MEGEGRETWLDIKGGSIFKTDLAGFFAQTGKGSGLKQTKDRAPKQGRWNKDEA